MTKPNRKNRTLFHCDNLPVLRAMNSELTVAPENGVATVSRKFR